MSAQPLSRADQAEQADLGAPACLSIGPAREPLAAGVLDAVEAWRVRLADAGIACRAVALYGQDAQYQLDFPADLGELGARWQAIRGQIAVGQAMALPPSAGQQQGDLLLISAIQLPDGQLGALGVALAPPQSDRTMPVLLLCVGWLQLALAGPRIERSQRALRLLDLIGHVGAQRQARAAAQEWINRTAAWARDEGDARRPGYSLMLFHVSGERPRWWVAADTAWAEKASPTLQVGAEVAMQAVVEQQEVLLAQAWAAPVLEGGRVVAVLVAVFVVPSEPAAGGVLPEPALAVLRTSLALAEPLLRHWREAERPLWQHHLATLAAGARHLREPGHLSWKFGAGGVLLALLVLLVWPVPDRVTANVVIEGQMRQVITTPFEGFLAEVLVRPGQQVKRGQLLARLDDRDLKLEQARFNSERDQASGRLRQAMTDHEASAQALALAEVQQAEAQLALVEAKLARSELSAPVDGLLVSGDWVQQIGAPVEVGKELFEIAAGKGYRVVLHVPDREIGRVHLGQTGALRLTGQPQTRYGFRVANLTATASVQETVNGFRVEADWLGEVPLLSPGMQGVGKIEVGTSNLLTVWTRSSLDWLRLKLWSWWW